MRLVQVTAVDRLLQLVEQRAAVGGGRDPFALYRRIEQRRPELALQLPRFAAGYAATPDAALAILDWLRARHDVPDGVDRQIRQLASAR